MRPQCVVEVDASWNGREMGWIENLARDQQIGSLRAVAKAMKKSDRWPTGDERDLESIANKVRHLDQGKDSAYWLRGRGKSILPALADVLNEDEQELLDRLSHEPMTASEGQSRWSFKVFPALRPLNLQLEAPFPGIPIEIARTGGPRATRTWWVARSGAGKTLVGRWLEQHGWTFLQPGRWAELEFPTEGRVFVELGSTAGLSIEMLAKIPPGMKLCVAAPSPPPTSGEKEEEALEENKHVIGARISTSTTAPGREAVRLVGVGGRGGYVGAGGKEATAAESAEAARAQFQIVSTPALRDWIQDLIHWAAARVSPGGGFDAVRLTKMFRAIGPVHLFATPGELLGFLGLVDDVGLDKLEAAQPDLRWIRVWLKAVLGRQDRRCPAGIAEVLTKRGPEILVDMEVERFRRGLEPALSEAAWIDLVPRAHAPDVDVPRLLAILDESGNDAPAQLRAMLAPDGASVVAGLQAIGALVEDDTGGLRLQPTWVANVLTELVYSRLYHDEADGLGALLLTSGQSDRALRDLIDDVRHGSLARFEACANAAVESVPSPEQLAALDGTVRAIGIALAFGEILPLSLVHSVWERQLRFLQSRYSNLPPAPLLSVAARDPRRGAATGSGAWFLAAFAISRTLTDAGRYTGPTALNPWGGMPKDERMRSQCLEALVDASSAFQADEEIARPEELRLAVYRLGGALLDRWGIVRRGSGSLDLQGPDLLVVLATGSECSLHDKELQSLLRLRFGLAALEDACTRRGVELAAVLAYCWRTWGTAEGYWPPTEWARRKDDRSSLDDVRRLWHAAPAEALSSKLLAQLDHLPEVWPHLTEAVWTRWLEAWSAMEGRWSDGAQAFWFVPERLALEAVRDGRVDPWCHDVRRVLWERMPDALVALADEMARLPAVPPPKMPSHSGSISHLVFSAPAEQCQPLVGRARAWVREPARFPRCGDWLPHWLGRVIEQRAPGWREAYSLLLEATSRTLS